MKKAIYLLVLLFVSLGINAQKPLESADGYILKTFIDKEKPICKVGETVKLTITLTKDSLPVDNVTIDWITTKDYYTPTKKSGKLLIKNGKAEFSSTLEEPGFLHCRFLFKTPQKTTLSTFKGVAFDPLQIQPSYDTPKDFDKYWADQKKLQAKQELNLRLMKVDSKSTDVEAFDVQANSFMGNFSAYMARPKGAKAKSLPAMIMFHGAGVASSRLSEVVKWAKEGVIVIDFNVHGLPNGMPASFYKELYADSLKSYFMKGVEHRDSLFFREMIMRDLRAIDIVTVQPEWDGKNLIAYGRSQGGGQAIVTAGLDSRVNLLCAEIPALCDQTGNVVGRVNGWPKLIGNDAEFDKNALKVVPYVDAVNFAKRTTAKAYVTVGFIDLSCPATSVYAMYNQLKGEKHILDIYNKGHVVSPESVSFVSEGVKEFLKSLKK